MFRRNDHFGRKPHRSELGKKKKKQKYIYRHIVLSTAVTIRYHTPRPVELYFPAAAFEENRQIFRCFFFADTKRASKERTVAGSYYVALNRFVGPNSDLEPNWINI